MYVCIYIYIYIHIYICICIYIHISVHGVLYVEKQIRHKLYLEGRSEEKGISGVCGYQSIQKYIKLYSVHYL